MMTAKYRLNNARSMRSVRVPPQTAISTTPRLSGLPLSHIKQKYLDAPLLLASVDPSNWDDTQLEPAHFSWSAAFAGDGTPILFFKQQFGVNLVRILADPADPQTWKMLDRSHKARILSIAAAHVDDGVISSGSFLLPNAAEAMRVCVTGPEHRKQHFHRLAMQMVSSKEAQQTAKSLSPDMPALVHAQDCVLVHVPPTSPLHVTDPRTRTSGRARPSVH